MSCSLCNSVMMPKRKGELFRLQSKINKYISPKLRSSSFEFKDGNSEGANKIKITISSGSELFCNLLVF